MSSDPALSTECWRAAKFLLSCLESLGVETRLIQAKVQSEGKNCGSDCIVTGFSGRRGGIPSWWGDWAVILLSPL